MSRDILLSLIDADPDQPRKHFDSTQVAELAESMSANGLIVPIMVRPVGSRFVIVHGERRYRAATSLGWATIPVEVRELDTEAARWFALVENIQRADLSPIEEANAYAAMLSTGVTQTELGQRIGKTQSYIATKLRLLKLPGRVQNYLNDGRLTEGHAKQLLRLSGGWVIMEIARHCAGSPHDSKPVAECKRLVDRALKHGAFCKALYDGSDLANDLLQEVWPRSPFENAQHIRTFDMFVRMAMQRRVTGRYDDDAGVDAQVWRMIGHDMVMRGDEPTEAEWRACACAAMRVMIDGGEDDIFFSSEYVLSGFPDQVCHMT